MPSSSWQIRTATCADVESMATMRRALQAHVTRSNPRLLPMSHNYSDSLPALYTESIQDADAHVLVAHNLEGVLVGMAIGRIVIHEMLVPSRVGRIDDVWIDPAARRLGGCRAFVQELLTFFEGHEIQIVELEHAVGNVEAELTWHSLGFRPLITLANATLNELKLQLFGEPAPTTT